jgi:simple sugar transport system permease protein
MVNTTQPTADLSPAPTVKKIQDERLREVSLVTKVMRRPELGALAGLILVAIFFLSTADASMFTLAGIMNILSPASQLGILAIAAALLMIGGEFDLSIGSMVAFTGLVFGAFITLNGWPLLLAIAATLAVAAVLGGLNGQMVIRTRLPSFIVTLAFLFILRGLSLVGLKWATGGSTQARHRRSGGGEPHPRAVLGRRLRRGLLVAGRP